MDAVIAADIAAGYSEKYGEISQKYSPSKMLKSIRAGSMQSSKFFTYFCVLFYNHTLLIFMFAKTTFHLNQWKTNC